MTAEIFQLRDFQNPKDLARLYSAEYEAEVAACMGEAVIDPPALLTPPQTLGLGEYQAPDGDCA